MNGNHTSSRRRLRIGLSPIRWELHPIIHVRTGGLTTGLRGIQAQMLSTSTDSDAETFSLAVAEPRHTQSRLLLLEPDHRFLE